MMNMVFVISVAVMVLQFLNVDISQSVARHYAVEVNCPVDSDDCPAKSQSGKKEDSYKQNNDF
jgi:hypothetical protein